MRRYTLQLIATPVNIVYAASVQLRPPDVSCAILRLWQVRIIYSGPVAWLWHSMHLSKMCGRSSLVLSARSFDEQGGGGTAKIRGPLVIRDIAERLHTASSQTGGVGRRNEWLFIMLALQHYTETLQVTF
jgi:hypothetical protein